MYMHISGTQSVKPDYPKCAVLLLFTDVLSKAVVYIAWDGKTKGPLGNQTQDIITSQVLLSLSQSPKYMWVILLCSLAVD